MSARPWSPAEVEAAIPVLIDRIEDATAGLLELGIDAAEKEWTYRKAKARAYVLVAGKNAEEREARALLSQVAPNVTVADLGLQRALADHAYANQRTVIRALETEADLYRTLQVSAREASK